ncbi:LANO_0H14950g1_1 [Lachancea nothofagi CBS 11611]|uniref:LANO_0H14950g1_1 n=1 Tax=Lachancea nothofagi CBS 11611 TaxID=1266666 RepID=A0A1G4KMI6_9SACH|nr:LANO_0H14950g1_1 [Lachancea nothofagi CBS 11611]
MASEGLASSSAQEWTVVVRFAVEQMEDLPLNVSNVDLDLVTVPWLRRMCRQLRGNYTNNRRLRFIRNGRFLTVNSDLQLKRYFEENRDEPVFYVQCIVGQELSAQEAANEDSLDEAQPNSEGTTTQAIGFDRLRSVGFSDEEIELLRQRFQSTYGDLEDLTRATGDSQDIRQLEEQWMETGANDDTTQMGAVGIANYKHNTDLLIGLTVGFVLGVFCFLLMAQEGLFNKRQRMAIVGGLMINVCFGLTMGFARG